MMNKAVILAVNCKLILRQAFYSDLKRQTCTYSISGKIYFVANVVLYVANGKY